MGWAARTETKTGFPMRVALAGKVSETIDVVNTQSEAIMELRSACDHLHARLLALETDMAKQAAILDQLLKGA